MTIMVIHQDCPLHEIIREPADDGAEDHERGDGQE